MTFDPFHTLSVRTVGFDRIFNELEATAKQPTFPPYNITEQGDDCYSIELALAGFDQDDIEISYQNNKLIIKTVDDMKQEENIRYLHRGISKRKFTREFTLADDVVVDGATMVNGMLYVDMTRVVPDHKKPRKIEIL